MPGVQFGLTVPADALNKALRHSYLDDVNRLLDTVKGSYSSAWLIDHLQFGEIDVLEGWTTLTYLCALHPELDWGHTVICGQFRIPALLAKMGATLQFLSGGRFTLGMGACWNREEHEAYGYRFPSASARVESLDESLTIIRALWTEERATFDGHYHRVQDAWCEPKPEPVPRVLIGAFGPKMLRLAARYADIWDVSGTPVDEYRTLVEQFELACEDVGRDPRSVRRSWSGGCICATSEARVAELTRTRSEIGEMFGYESDVDMVGTPQRLIDRMAPFMELGVDLFNLDCGGFPDLTTTETLARDVLPVLQRL